MTGRVLDVSAAAREQMRTARAALDARAAYLAAQDASYKAYLVREATEADGGWRPADEAYVQAHEAAQRAGRVWRAAVRARAAANRAYLAACGEAMAEVRTSPPPVDQADLFSGPHEVG